MPRFLRYVWATITFALTLIGILALPTTLEAIGDTAPPSWLNQTNLLWTFAASAMTYIAWMDVRPFFDKARKQKRYREAMNRPDGWSLSFAAGTGFQFIHGPFNDLGPHYHTVLVQGIRIHNLSADRSRVVDLRLGFPGLSNDGALVELAPKRNQTDGRFQFPLDIGPDGNISGDVEFEVPPEVRDRITQAYVYTVDKLKINFVIFDHVSGKSKTVKLAEEYDAYKGHLRVTVVDS